MRRKGSTAINSLALEEEKEGKTRPSSVSLGGKKKKLRRRKFNWYRKEKEQRLNASLQKEKKEFPPRHANRHSKEGEGSSLLHEEKELTKSSEGIEKKENVEPSGGGKAA